MRIGRAAGDAPALSERADPVRRAAGLLAARATASIRPGTARVDDQATTSPTTCAGRRRVRACVSWPPQRTQDSMKFQSKPINEHPEAPIADAGRLDDELARWRRREAPERTASEEGNACFVLSVHGHRDTRASVSAQLEEITSLVQTQGDNVVATRSYALDRPDARTFVRSGVAASIGERALDCGADMLVVDAELSPSQTRNLEDAAGLPVCDREAVILNVFERHAKTRRARIQVEIAHLEYLRPRIRGIGLNMDQQAGGIMGSRGSGETASELLARQLDGRLSELRRGLAQLRSRDVTQRKRRDGCARVALVGYTNAGKTSLMNGLTGEQLSARDRAFETLDTTTRCLTRHGGDVLLADTVGFIRRLPDRLFESFASTLAEAAEASLLLCVVDLSDSEAQAHMDTTRGVLERLGAIDVPRLWVFNKSDRVGAPQARSERLAAGEAHATVSSRDDASVTALKTRILAQARGDRATRQVFVTYDNSQVMRRIYRDCRVLESHAAEHGTQLRIEGPQHLIVEIARATRRRQS